MHDIAKAGDKDVQSYVHVDLIAENGAAGIGPSSHLVDAIFKKYAPCLIPIDERVAYLPDHNLHHCSYRASPGVVISTVAVDGLPPSGADIVRGVFWLTATPAYAGVWLALAVAFSTVIRSPATSALAVLSVWLLLTVFWSMIAPLVAGSSRRSTRSIR